YHIHYKGRGGIAQPFPGGKGRRDGAQAAFLSGGDSSLLFSGKRRSMGTFQLVKKEFDKLVDGGASSPARCRVSNLRFEPSAVSPSAKPENPLGFQPSCHPYQFLLKSFRFPGAKTARKRVLLWKMGFSAAKILPCPPYMPLGTIEIREGFGPLELSKGFSTV
ncbi:MAG: hypothetical protein MR620_09275, partial [Clostridiales bacterium]|nr:hypothetical protein [Clostridiales bacterium]